MMTLYLLRHGIAEDRAAPGIKKDADRVLTAEGRQKVRRLAKALGRLEVQFDRIFSSPYLRARQTAELVAGASAQGPKVELWEELTPDGDALALIARLKQLKPVPGHVLLVGHEPYLSGLASLLLTGTPELSLTLKKAGLCVLTATTLRPGRCATLEWLLAPRHLALMS